MDATPTDNSSKNEREIGGLAHMFQITLLGVLHYYC